MDDVAPGAIYVGFGYPGGAQLTEKESMLLSSICLFALGCTLFALQCAVVILYSSGYPPYYIPVGFIPAFLAVIAAIIRLAGSKQNYKLLSDIKQKILGASVAITSLVLIIIDCILIDAEGKNFRASIYLSMEIIVAGSLILLTLPLLCDRKSSTQTSLSQNQSQGTSVENGTLILGPECSPPPKYEDIFPTRETV